MRFDLNFGCKARLMLATGAAGLAVGIGATAYAQETPDQATSSAGINDIVVTARKSAENQQRVPIAITTVTSEALANLSVRDISEVQKLTPGLYMTSSQTAGRVKITIRGQREADSRLTTDPSVGVYIDGVNFARSYGLRASLVDIDQVEVLKGPQGTLFGKNTTGGAINITTKHPTYEWGGYADLLYGSYNNMQAIGVLNAPLVPDKAALRLVGQIISREGYGKAGNGQDLNNDDTRYGRALLRLDPADNVRMLFSADYVRQRNNGPNLVILNDLMLANANSASNSLGAIAAEMGLNRNSAADRLAAYNAWKVYYDAYQTGSPFDGYNTGSIDKARLYDRLDHYGFSGQVEVDLGNVTAKSITAYRHLKRAYFQDTDGTPFDIGFTVQSTWQKNFSQEFQLTSIDGHGLDWQIGLFYNNEKGNELVPSNNRVYIDSNRSRVSEAGVKNTSKAAYAQAVYNFTDRFRVTAGIRYTRDTRALDSKNRIDPSLALQPLPTPPVPQCLLLSPAAGGPVYPDCHYKVSTAYEKATWLISADWRPVDNLMLYGSVSTGYRAGGLTWQGSTVVQPSVAALEAVYTPFLPESVTNYELGFKSDLLGRRLRINGAFFYQDYKDIQARVRDVVDNFPVQLFRNAASAVLYGGELEVTAAPTDNLTLNANVGYLHADYKKFFARDAAGNILDLSNRPYSSPKWTYNLGATYEIPLADGAIKLNANYAWVASNNLSEDVDDVVGATQPSYGLLDARISWHIESQGLDFAIFGKNLTNEHYLTSANNYGPNGFYVGTFGDPRTYGIQVRKTF